MQVFEELDYGPEDSVPFCVLCQHPVFQDLMEKSTQHQLVVSLSPGFRHYFILLFPALIYTLIFYLSPYSSSLSFRTFMICCYAAWMEKMRKNKMSLTAQHLSKKKIKKKKRDTAHIYSVVCILKYHFHQKKLIFLQLF